MSEDGEVCEYNDLVHISDWYHIMMGITEIGDEDADYDPDSDHTNLWENIRCKCKGKKTEDFCDNNFTPRSQLIMMRMCGEADADYDEGGKYYYSAYVRNGFDKLVVNGSTGITETCDNLTNVVNSAYLFDYIEADDTTYPFG